ncbi:bifunctional diaminohydroxyphosphoribosylaminopyrimidine deaminase/5-amino-6-(5-phosphoribosylamino)uracil reductase RibD [Cytophagaceae bacterium ABcell3]|nr:bifunctional diaminohydroxyphosphoribosylaminopyrimidine deaminase/5-amino-6-(5-phosphoribosylamino)uracil reductase RibD [Cytophagaceae bacterium ABcell3]
MDQDKVFMQRALELAVKGAGNVSPNPMVGCVIVKDKRIIGEGWHQKYGEAHAEVNAINSVRHKQDLMGATLYVTLEPCSHYGKTPPCADLIVQYPFSRVVVASADPNPLVCGKGNDKIKAAGIEVDTGVLEDKADEINKRFFTYINKKRPYIIFKWAETADGFIARSNYDSKWISNSYSRMLVHKWRSEEDAIMVGTRTAFYDDPKLNVRDWYGKDPIKALIDRKLKISDNAAMFGSGLTYVYNSIKDEEHDHKRYVKISGQEPFLYYVMQDLYKRNVQSVFVEGGSGLFKALVDCNLWDEARIFKGAAFFGEGIAAPRLRGETVTIDDVAGDELRIIRNLIA